MWLYIYIWGLGHHRPPLCWQGCGALSLSKTTEWLWWCKLCGSVEALINRPTQVSTTQGKRRQLSNQDQKKRGKTLRGWAHQSWKGKVSRHPAGPAPMSSGSQCTWEQSIWWASWCWFHQPSGIRTYEEDGEQLSFLMYFQIPPAYRKMEPKDGLSKISQGRQRSPSGRASWYKWSRPADNHHYSNCRASGPTSALDMQRSAWQWWVGWSGVGW